MLAILAFSLVAGFSFNGHVTCGGSDAITVSFKYPYSTYSYFNGTTTKTTNSLPYSKASSAAQLFVAWGVLSMLYCLVALAVYMLLTANEHLEKVVDMLVYTVSWWILSCWYWSHSMPNVPI